MNKKLLANKILNFKKNKKNISEERSQLDEFLGMDLKTDKGLGDLQSGLSTASTIATVASFIPGPIGLAARVASPVLSGGAWAVNKTRVSLDAKGVVPSETSPEALALQGKLLGYGALAAGMNIPGANKALQHLPHWAAGTVAQFGRYPTKIRLAGRKIAHPLAGELTPIGRTLVTGAAGVANLLSTEWAARNADPITDRLGLPNIPGISKRLTKKAPYGTVPAFDVSRAPTTLDLVAAANASRN